jgi:hypothetical protein
MYSVGQKQLLFPRYFVVELSNLLKIAEIHRLPLLRRIRHSLRDHRTGPSSQVAGLRQVGAARSVDDPNGGIEHAV